MKILMLGDVMGRAGRDILSTELPGLREKLGVDFVLVNGENAAGAQPPPISRAMPSCCARPTIRPARRAAATVFSRLPTGARFWLSR